MPERFDTTPDVVPDPTPDSEDQETWDPEGTGDTHHGVEADGHPLPEGDEP